MNTDNFLIRESDIELAQATCRAINESDTRNRAVANVTAANIAAQYFDENQFKIDTKSGLHNIAAVLEDIDIADIYINNSYIDVRIYFDDNEICVPKSHFINNLLPVAYMFVKLNEDLSGGTVTGFVLPENINQESCEGDYYIIDETSLVSFFDIESRLINNDDTYSVEEKEVFAYLDGTIEDKNAFYAKLLTSEDGRQKLARAAKAQYIFNFVSVADDAVDTGSDFINDMPIDLGNDDSLLDMEDNNFGFELSDSDELGFTEIDETFGENGLNEDDLDAIDSSSSFDYSTTISPNIDSFEESEEAENVEQPEAVQEDSIVDILPDEPEEEEREEEGEIEIPSNEGLDNLIQNIQGAEESETFASEQNDETPNEQIGALFNNPAQDSDSENLQENIEGNEVQAQKKPKSSIKLLLLIGLLVVLGGLGYLGYNKFSAQPIEDESQNNIVAEPTATANNQEQGLSQDAMPIEGVEVTTPTFSQNEATTETIPAIEQNLDASILVSNLKVDWEVPAGYVSNTAAKRYLVKLGKVIQLNLKTELLLLNRPPITNKIAVEIKYNSGNKKFEAVGVTTSSGEKSVDDLILQTVNKALAMNLSANTDSFSKLQGNPILIIHL